MYFIMIYQNVNFCSFVRWKWVQCIFSLCMYNYVEQIFLSDKIVLNNSEYLIPYYCSVVIDTTDEQHIKYVTMSWSSLHIVIVRPVLITLTCNVCIVTHWPKCTVY